MKCPILPAALAGKAQVKRIQKQAEAKERYYDIRAR